MRYGHSGKYTLVDAFSNAFAGIVETFKTQRNIRVQSAVGALAIVLGFVFSIDVQTWIVIIACIGMVLGLECVNTAIEAAVDLASPEYNELAKTAKDCAAGAVLIASIASLVVGIVVFAPKIIQALFG